MPITPLRTAVPLAIMLGSAGPAHTADLLIFDCNNCYSPTAVFTPQETKFFAGGWRYKDEVHDQIWAVYCDNVKWECAQPVLVLPNGRFNHVNDPKVVRKPAMTLNGRSYPEYYIVYMTCTTGNGAGDGADSICAATSYEGHVWVDPQHGVEPQVILDMAWLPSAVVENDKVRLYVNDNKFGGRLTAYDCGESGIVCNPKPTGLVFTDRYYADLNQKAKLTNIDVTKDPKTGEYRMLAENNSAPVSVIDELASKDGITWTMRYPAKIVPSEGEYRVGTPAYLEGIQMYASTKQTNSEGFKIYARLP